MAQLKALAVLQAHKDRVWYASWSPDGNYLATCSGDHTVRIWDCRSLLLSSQAMDGNDMNIEENANDNVSCVAVLNEDGHTHSRSIRAVEWCPTHPNMIACASFDGTTSLWIREKRESEDDDDDDDDDDGQDSNSGGWTCVSTLEGHENEVKSVSWDASGQLLATGARDRTVWIWEVTDNGTESDCVSVLNGHSQDVKMVKWHPTREILASSSYDDTMHMWCEDSDDWYSADTLRHHKSTVWAIDFNHDGSRLVSGSADQDVIIWQMEEYEQQSANADGVFVPNEKPFVWRPVCVIHEIHKRDVYGVDWSKVQTDLIATAAGDNSLKIFRIKQKTSARDGNPQQQQTDPSSTELEAEQVVALNEAHESDLNCVRWHPKVANILVTCSDDETIKIWKLTEN